MLLAVLPVVATGCKPKVSELPPPVIEQPGVPAPPAGSHEVAYTLMTYNASDHCPVWVTAKWNTAQ